MTSAGHDAADIDLGSRGQWRGIRGRDALESSTPSRPAGLNVRFSSEVPENQRISDVDLGKTKKKPWRWALLTWRKIRRSGITWNKTATTFFKGQSERIQPATADV